MLATKPRRPARRVKFDNFQQLLDDLGGIPAARVLLNPAPGTATVRDVVRLVDGDARRLVELFDRTLVEKSVGNKESGIASELIRVIGNWSHDNGDVGFVGGEGATWQILAGLVRLPDVSFIPWARLPNRRMPAAPVPKLAPDLAVEVVSKGNTKAEMKRKVGEYFKAGVRLVWLVFPKARTVRAYTSAADVAVLTEADTLTGGDVLPGFELPLAKLFKKLPDPPKRKAKPRGKPRRKK